MSKFSINPGHNRGKKLCKVCSSYFEPQFMSTEPGLCKSHGPKKIFHPFITNWDNKRGYGWVDKNVFVHASHLPKGMKITSDSRIEYVKYKNARGYIATQIIDRSNN